jgi:hypothetical protein
MIDLRGLEFPLFTPAHVLWLKIVCLRKYAMAVILRLLGALIR